MSEPSRLALGLHRGVCLRCPQCGEGALFAGFLTVAERCDACGADNTVFPSDDAPPYLTLLLVGHLVAPLIFLADTALDPPLWLIMAVALPAIAAVTLAILPFVKGAVVGFAWANGVTRETARQ